MFMEKKESRRENVQVDNEVVNYLNGKAIIQDDFGELFYLEIDEEFVVLGETVLSEDLRPISELPEEEQAKILSRITG